MTNEQLVFLQLLKVGLWGDRELDALVAVIEKGEFSWQAVIDLAIQQASLGVMTDGMVRLPLSLRPEKNVYFNVIAQTSDIEKENKSMNGFAPVLMGKLKEKDVSSLLLKGQGVALCYPQPLHRMSGDIDLLVSDDSQFYKGCGLMKRISTSWDWDERSGHAEFQAMGFVVELHGKYGFTICPKVTKNLRAWNKRRLNDFRQKNGMLLPSVQFDAVFIFSHMLNHFMTGGVGLRQISDWMMFLHANAQKIDRETLREDLEFLGLMKFWKAFAALAINLLAFPAEEMPFHEEENKSERQALQLMSAVFKTGNFGALQKAEQLSVETNKWVKKVHTAFGQIPVYWRAGKLFPWESLYCFCKYTKGSLF